MELDHSFRLALEWTGNRGSGTSGFRDYGRDHVLRAEGRPELRASAARVFHGDADLWNPEEQLIAALSGCHLLSYLHVAVKNGIVVEAYSDEATGELGTRADGSGRFNEVVLRPVVTISAGDEALARELHAEANRLCFIANSVNFPVRHEAEIRRSARGSA